MQNFQSNQILASLIVRRVMFWLGLLFILGVFFITRLPKAVEMIFEK